MKSPIVNQTIETLVEEFEHAISNYTKSPVPELKTYIDELKKEIMSRTRKVEFDFCTLCSHPISDEENYIETDDEIICESCIDSRKRQIEEIISKPKNETFFGRMITNIKSQFKF